MVRRAIGIAFVLAFWLGGATSALASTPGAFKDDYDAALASDGSTLWISVAGRNAPGQPLGVRVYRKAESGWNELPKFKPSVPDGSKLLMTAAPSIMDGGPCIGVDGGREISVRCRLGDRWKRVGALSQAGELVDLKLVNGDLTALTSKRAGREVRAFVATAAVWMQLGPTITKGPGGASLGEGVPAPDAQVDVLTTESRTGERTVRSFDGEEWIESPPLSGVAEGPSRGGLVRLPAEVIVPVIDASPMDWTFSTFSLSDGAWDLVGGKPLNRGPGSAQGRLDYTGGTTWASWQQHDPTEGLLRTRIYAAPFRNDGSGFERPQSVWRGRTIGPGAVEVEEADGVPYVLYARAPKARPPESGLAAYVSRLDR